MKNVFNGHIWSLRMVKARANELEDMSAEILHLNAKKKNVWCKEEESEINT